MNLPSISFRCECSAKSKCQRLTVIDMQDNEFEINGCFLKPKSVKRLVEFLQTKKLPKDFYTERI